MHPARQARLRAWPLVLLVLLVIAGGGSANISAQTPPAAPSPGPTPPRDDGRDRGLTERHFSAELERAAALPAPIAAPPGYDAERAYVPLDGGEVAAVSLREGIVLWSVKAAVTGSPATGDGLVFLPTDGAIVARDAVTGGPRWAAAVDGRLSAPLVWQNGWLLAGTDKGGAIMLRAATGERLWERAVDAPPRARAVMTGDRVYVPLDNGHLLALGLQRGDTIWDRHLRARVTALTPLDDRVFAGADDRFLYCLDAKDGDTKWRWRTGGTIVGTPTVDEDKVYFIALDNILYALDRGNGHQRWRAPVPFRPLAGPFPLRGLLVVAGLNQLHAYRPSNGAEAGSIEVPQVLAAPPHLLPARGTDEEALIVLATRESEIRLMRPADPPLEAKPFPPTPIYPMWPGAGGDSPGSDLRPSG